MDSRAGRGQGKCEGNARAGEVTIEIWVNMGQQLNMTDRRAQLDKYRGAILVNISKKLSSLCDFMGNEMSCHQCFTTYRKFIRT